MMIRFVYAAFLCALLGVSLPAYADDAPSFEDYPATIYRGKLHDPHLVRRDCSELNAFWCFRTRLKEAAREDGITFAGSFTVAIWGCGTECQSGAVIDRKSGTMFWLPTASLGYDYRADSRLLIVNPNPSEYWSGAVPEWLYREFYVLGKDGFSQVYSDKGDPLNTPHPIPEEVMNDLEKYCADHPEAYCFQQDQ